MILLYLTTFLFLSLLLHPHLDSHLQGLNPDPSGLNPDPSLPIPLSSPSPVRPASRPPPLSRAFSATARSIRSSVLNTAKQQGGQDGKGKGREGEKLKEAMEE
eukprot:CAMPEP_0118660446 /NCGR_PEP_ID=MMETSP0785-20121206/15688_1 /TAXON_ID=91992 /ORGANISM="Bolidomonas pacifica, Strain CCMP 1866" /LENGTH=102 /DNA_ID=CAMNT_0006553695 /DNA_START=72 /DNA_END=377 /DNA_ORIENTATION=+